MAVTNGFANLALDSSVDAVKTAVDAVKDTLDTGITVSLDSASLSALENTTVELGSTSLAALESITTSGPLTDVQLRATPVAISDNGGSITVDGTVAVSGTIPVSGTFWQATQPVSLSSVPLPTGAATETTLSAIDTKLGGTLTVSSDGLTDVQLRATPVPVSISGSIPVTIASAIEITNDAGNPIPVSGTVTANAGTGFQTNALTNTELRASAVNIADGGSSITVDGTIAATQSGTWNVGINAGTNVIGKLSVNDGVDIGDVTINNPSIVVTGPLTDTELRASPIAVDSSTISLESTQQDIKNLQSQIAQLADSINTLVQFLYANQPRRDVANRVISNGSEVTQPVSGSITNLNNLVSIGGYSPSNSMFGVPLHVYNQIEVT